MSQAHLDHYQQVHVIVFVHRACSTTETRWSGELMKTLKRTGIKQETQEQQAIDALKLKGGKVCLNFTNTMGWHTSAHPVEWLHDYGDLVRWSRRVQSITEDQSTVLLRLATEHPEVAEEVYRRAIQLREALFHIFLAVLRSEALPEEDLAVFNREHAAMLARLQIVPAGQKLVLAWSGEGPALALPLWQVTKSAGEVLTSEELERVSLCADTECGWLFFDQSKNRSRKWCDSQDCGNRDRVQRHYQHKRARRRGDDIFHSQNPC